MINESIILTGDYGEKLYCIIKNKGGKVWILPCKNMNIALNLYQPSSIKGIFFKIFVPYLYRFKIIQKFLNIKITKISCSRAFQKKIREIFGYEGGEFSFFLGTPSLHQKMTIQISKGKKILGYCKVSNNKEVINLFNNEQKLLDYLKKKQINNVPSCLYNGVLTVDTNIFVQSTKKSCKSVLTHKIMKEHILFLRELYNKTKVECMYEDSDYKDAVNKLKVNIHFLKSDNDIIIVKKALEVVELEIKKNKYFSFYHGDFTPWNTFLENKKLFVFDFEYAQILYPPMIDIFHFFTQTAIFQRHDNAELIYESFKKTFVNGEYKGMFDNPELYYMYYLVDIISLYVSRDRGDFSIDVSNNIKIWINLLNKLNQANK